MTATFCFLCSQSHIIRGVASNEFNHAYCIKKDTHRHEGISLLSLYSDDGCGTRKRQAFLRNARLVC